MVARSHYMIIHNSDFNAPLKIQARRRNSPAYLRVRSKAVIHSSFIPNRMKQDAVPGMVTEMWVTPTKEGDYSGSRRRSDGKVSLGKPL